MAQISEGRNNNSREVTVILDKEQMPDVAGVVKINSRAVSQFFPVSLEMNMRGTFLRYNTTGAVNVKERLMNPIEKDDFIAIVKSILGIRKQVETNGIEEKNVMFSQDYIYFFPQSFNVAYTICVPANDFSNAIDMKSFMKSVGQLVKPNSLDCQLFVKSFYQFLDTVDDINVENFDDFVVNGLKVEEPAEEAPTVESAPVVESAPEVESVPIEEEEKNLIDINSDFIQNVVSEGMKNAETDVESASAVIETLVTEPVQEENEAPVVESAPTVKETPVVESAPTVEETPVGEPAPTVNEAPVEQSAPVIEVKFCPKCGGKRVPGAKFCRNCGNQFPVVVAEPVVQAQPTVAQEPQAAVQAQPTVAQELQAAVQAQPVVAQQPVPQEAPAPEVKAPISENPYILRKKTGQKVYITKDSFTIGKGSENVDFIVTDNPTISRVHVIITKVDEQFMVTDKGSLNKSFIDGFMLIPDTPMQIFAGQTLVMSDEEFFFGFDNI